MEDWGSHKENTIMITLGKWPLRLALAGVLSSATARSDAQFTITNPNGSARTSWGEAGLDDIGLAGGKVAAVVDKAFGKELAFQVEDGRIVVTAKLSPYETRVLSARTAGRKAAKDGLELSENDQELSVTTTLYTVTLDKAKGYTIKGLVDLLRKKTLRVHSSGGLTLYKDGENDKYIKRWMGVSTPFPQRSAKVTCQILERGPARARILLRWDTAVGSIEETLTFVDGTRLIDHDVAWHCTTRVVNAEFGIGLNGFAGRGKSLFYPEGERFTGVWHRGYCRPTPGYRYAWNPKLKTGVGVVTHDAANTAYFESYMMDHTEGWGIDQTRIKLFTSSRRWHAVPGDCRFSFSLIVGGTPKEVAALAGQPAMPFTLGKLGAGVVAQLATPGAHGPFLTGRENTFTLALADVKTGGKVAVRLDGKTILEAPAAGTVTGSWAPVEADIGRRDLTVSLAGSVQHYRVEVAKPVALEEVRPIKLIHRLNAPARTRVVLQSRSAGSETVRMVSEVVGGVDERREVDSRTVKLEPNERKAVVIDWNSGTREYGLTFRVKLLVNGKIIDEKEDYTSATNFAPKIAQVGINGPNANQPGSEHSWAQQYRDKYIGIVEYYCWPPDELLELTPDTEKFQPHTESQGSYEATIHRKFIQDFVKEADTRGVHIYAMDAGMISLPGMLDRPDLVKYTADGQPWIYNGKLYGANPKKGEPYHTRRKAVGLGAPYDPEFVKDWGNEMAASVDMFGWKGCRWDWGFVPSAPGDPLLWDQTEEERQRRVWYNSKGVPSTKLFPDPDQTGAELLKIWRTTVRKRHPDYVYGTNFGASEDRKRLSPRYFKEATTNSFLLFEFLLGSCSEKYNTWEKWAKAMTEATQRVRVNGGQPCIGYMRGYAADGTALRLSQYLMFASGCHWAGGAGMPHSLDDTWKRFRFATRFSEYYYDPGFLLLPEERRGEVSVQAHARVFWRQFVYERVRDQGRDVTVHLLNLPESDFIIMHHEVPAAKENITISLKLAGGEKLERASIMLPDPLPHAGPLQSSTAGTAVTVKVPRLETAAIVLLEVSK